MSIPRLNRNLTLEGPSQVSDGAGGTVTTWTPLGQVWASVEPRIGREVRDGAAPISRVPYRIVLRASPVGSPSRPKPEQRFREGTRIFTIQAVAEAREDMRYLTCFAEEEVVA